MSNSNPISEMNKAIIGFPAKESTFVAHRKISDNERAVFKGALENNFWYKHFLGKKGFVFDAVDEKALNWNSIPILTKEDVFQQGSFSALVGKRAGEIHSLMLSSGHSGNFSLGFISCNEMAGLATGTDSFFSQVLGIKPREALCINASAMGVRAYTNHVCCDTGPRPDVVVALLKEVAPSFSKIIVIADPHLVKCVAELGTESGIDWKDLPVWFISGGDWFSESLRGYVHHLTFKSAACPEMGCWLGIFGVTELGYPLFFETPHHALARANQLAEKNRLRNAIRFRIGNTTTPFFFTYSGNSLYVEQFINESGLPELIFTVSKENRIIPMIRYLTGDLGELLPDVKAVELGLKPPLISFWGRKNNCLPLNNNFIFVTDIKELLFIDFEMASLITGYFTLKRLGKKVKLTVQIGKGKTINEMLVHKFKQVVEKEFATLIEVSFVQYEKMENQMELDFERKFSHLK
jgi:phenylacetate-CoA ligase